MGGERVCRCVEGLGTLSGLKGKGCGVWGGLLSERCYQDGSRTILRAETAAVGIILAGR